MSHFSRLRTKLATKDYLLQALRDLGYEPEVGDLQVKGWLGMRTPVEIRVATGEGGYDIGFVRDADAYACVADWYGVRGVSQARFIAALTQRYAYRAACAKLAEQGFDLVSEEHGTDGRIHLVLRRTV